MQEQIIPTSNINLESITLIESHFSRPVDLDITDKSKLKNDTKVEIVYSDLENENFSVYIDFGFNLIYESNSILDIKMLVSGEFRKPKEVKGKDIEVFANVNAPSIIFPFIRENVASLTAKGMFGAILMPPINFIQLFKEKKEKTTENT